MRTSTDLPAGGPNMLMDLATSLGLRKEEPKAKESNLSLRVVVSCRPGEFAIKLSMSKYVAVFRLDGGLTSGSLSSSN